MRYTARYESPMSPLYIEMMAVKSRHGGAISMTGVIARAIMHRDGEFYFFFPPDFIRPL